MNTIVGVIAFALGIALGFYLRARNSKSAEALAADLAAQLYQTNEQQRQAEVAAVVENAKQNFAAMVDNVKQSFGGLALDALGKQSEQFLAMAGERLGAERDAGARELEAKRGLIGQQLGALSDGMTAKLGEVTALVKSLEGDRRQAMGEVSQRLQNAGEVITQLSTVTSSLREALRSSRQRGSWGERQAEDLFRACGFIENVNYVRQSTLIDGSRPDFQFILPQDRRLSCDVKVPMDSYLKMLDSTSEMERARCKKDFLRDARARMKELTTKGYIDPSTGTLDIAIMLIPIESVFEFVIAEDPQFIDDAMRNRVLVCSPFSFFGVLSVIRQLTDSFVVAQTANEVISLISAFSKQWILFRDQLEKVGRKIEDTSKEYEVLSGIRLRQLERPLMKVEQLRLERQLPVAEDVA